MEYPDTNIIAYFVYSDGEDAALTIMRLLYDGSRGFEFINTTSLNLCVSEQIVSENGFWPRKNYGRPIPFDMRYVIADGSSRHANWDWHGHDLFPEETIPVYGQRMFVFKQDEHLMFITPDEFQEYEKHQLAIDNITIQFSAAGTNEIYPAKANLVNPFTISMKPGYKSVLLETASMEIQYPPSQAWYTDPRDTEVLIYEDKIVAKNRNDGREKVICLINPVQDDLGSGLWGDLRLEFLDQTDGLLREIHFFTQFSQKSNLNYGGITGRYVRPDSTMFAEFLVENERERKTIAGYKIQDVKVTFNDGNTIFSLKPIGDKNNPFTLIKHSFSQAENWFSDPELSTLIFKDYKIMAINRLTGEEKLLLSIDTKWEPLNNKGAGNYIYTFVDETNNALIGGSFGGAFSRVNIGKGNNLRFAYRFDGIDVNTNNGDFSYISGKSPKVQYYIVKDDTSDSLDELLRDAIATVVFKDGNTLRVIFPY